MYVSIMIIVMEMVKTIKIMRMHLISFGGTESPNKYIYKALGRLKNQAEKLGWFDSITMYTDEDLKKDTLFWNKHKNFIDSHKRWYGFSIWKPYLIKKHLEKIDNNDILIFMDAGCEIQFTNNLSCIDKNKFLEEITTNQFLAFPYSIDVCIKHYTKSICYNFFKISDQELLNNKIYLEANRIGIIKNSLIIQVIDEWWNIMDTHYELYDLSENIPYNSEFKESRADQMLLNFVLYRNKLLTPNNIFRLEYKSVFHAPRNKTGLSIFCRDSYKNEKKCTCGCCVL